MTANPLILKLESLTTLSDADRVALNGISAHPRSAPGRTDLIREGDPPNGIYLILKGMACRYKLRATARARSWPTLCLATFATSTWRC